MCTHLPLRRRSNSTLQQRSPNNCNHHQVCHGHGCQGWACSALYCSLQNGSPPANPLRHGVAATMQPYANRQLNSSRSYTQNNCSKTIQNDGHEDMVATMSNFIKSVLLLLGCRFKNWADYSTKHHPDIDHEAYYPTHAGIWNIPRVLPQWVHLFLYFLSNFISIW